VDSRFTARKGHVWISARAAETGLLVLVFGVGLFLRFFRLASVPVGVLYDEAYNGIDIIRILDGARPLFLPDNYGREALFIYLQAVSVSLFGQTDLALRLVSAVIGAITLPLSYLVIRRLFGHRVALLTCAWLAVSLWHVMYSRIGLRTISLPLALAMAFYFLWRGLDERWRSTDGSPPQSPSPSRSTIWFALAGVALGLSLYTYTTARLAPLAVLFFAGYLALVHWRKFRQVVLGLTICGVMTIVVFLPEGWYFLNHPGDFVERAADVSVLNSDLNQGDPTQGTIFAIRQTLGMFSFHGDDQWDRNIPPRPIFDPISSALGALGLALMVRRSRDPRYAFALIWLVFLLIPSFVSIRNVPNFLRVTGLIPILFALPAVGTAWIWRRWELVTKNRLRFVPLGVVAIAFAAGAYETYESYFGIWAPNSHVSQTFNSDRWLAIRAARAEAASTHMPVYVGAGDADAPLSQYALGGQNRSVGVRTFDGSRTLVFPQSTRPTTYIFPSRDLPPTDILRRFFGPQSGTVIGQAPDGETITEYVLNGKPAELIPQRRIPARFGDDLQVFGYDVTSDAQANGVLTVHWYWKILANEPRELAFFNQVIDESGQKRAQTDDRAFSPGYWPVGKTGVSTFQVKLDPSLPTGIYWVIAGVYVRNTLQRLPVIDPNGQQAGTQVELGPIKVHGRPGPVPRPDHPLSATFGDHLALVGYDLKPSAPRPGDPVDVTLFWSASARPSRDYTVFVHLLDRQGQLVASADSPPRGGRAPTSVWDAGDVVADPHALAVPANASTGPYTVEVGLYQKSSGRRLAVFDSTGRKVGDRVLIPGPTAQVP
jgi:4-amino-4-deoxy-L-arabinose transferase-like glycosyltransferase